MISLYVCDFPQNLERDDLSPIFSEFEGFIETTKIKSKQRRHKTLVQVLDTVEQQKDCVNNGNQQHHGNYQKPSGLHNYNQSNGHQGDQNIRHKFQEQSNNQNQGNGYQNGAPRSILKNSTNGYQIPNNSSSDQQVSQNQSAQLLSNTSQSLNNLNGQSQISSSPQQPPVLNMNNIVDQSQIMNNVLNLIKDQSTDFANSLPGDILNQLLQNPSALQYLSKLGNQTAPSTANSSASFPSPVSNQSNNFQDSNAQQLSQLLLQTNPLLSNLANLHSQQLYQQQSQSHQLNTTVINSLNRLSQSFKHNLPIPKNATNTVYVEGLPHDTTEREVAHIFRPFLGFKQLRLIPRDTKDGQRVHFAFADFESVYQTTMVINTLQGYRFHKDDIIGLQFSYAVTNNKHGRREDNHRDHNHNQNYNRHQNSNNQNEGN
eukprot:403347348